MKTRSILLQTFLVIIILAGLGYIFRMDMADLWNGWMAEPTPEPVTFQDIIRNNNKNSKEPVDENINSNVNIVPEPVAIPDEFNLEVPFTTQAPYANWDYPYQEACEEASALNVHYYYQGKIFNQEIADKEILDLVAWENDYFGDYMDTTAEETAEFIREYWGYERAEAIYNPTVQDIKEHVAAGRPVIVPAAGKMLGNPNFRNGGPLYHMFVVRGYTADTFITNDVGTRKGEEYVYNINVIMDAMHDWNDGDVNNGQKVIVVTWPNN